MDIERVPFQGGVEVRLKGELVARDCPSVREAIEDAIAGLDRPAIVLLLEGVAYMDSSGLGTLIFIDRLASQRGGRLFLLRVPPLIRKFLQLMGLGEKFTMIQEREEAARVESRP